MFRASFQFGDRQAGSSQGAGFRLGGLRLRRREIDRIAEFDGIAARCDFLDQMRVMAPKGRFRQIVESGGLFDLDPPLAIQRSQVSREHEMRAMFFMLPRLATQNT